MKKLHTKYVCQACGYESPRWAGKCPNCGGWSSFVEELTVPEKKSQKSAVLKGAGSPVAITEVPVGMDARVPTHIGELDRVLGGGIIPGSLVLVGGDPGIGKSTLMLQMAARLPDHVILYVTGEESAGQIKMRADRLDVKPSKKLLLFAETNLSVIEAIIDRATPDLVIVDSIQTLYRPDLESAPGTVSQVREATAVLMRTAKSLGVPIFLVGHVTKEGVIAGPRVIEHMVDTVLQFEGEKNYSYRVLRSMKNRFGSTNEIGIFEMYEGGLREVTNPSEVFLSQRLPGTTGSTVVASMEGSRPLLLEVQALVAPTSYGVPQRTATGFDARRLQMLLAVLEKRIGLHMGQYDVFVNVAGGVRIDEPAADLGVALSIVSSLRERAVNPATVAAGEIGLGGEIRKIHQIEKRVAEARKLGFKRFALPRNNTKSIRHNGEIDLFEVATVQDAIDSLLAAG